MTVLDVLASMSHTLIRSEVRTAAYREALEQGAVQAIRDHGCSLNDVSAQTGLTVDELRALLDQPRPLDDLADLAGTR